MGGGVIGCGGGVAWPGIPPWCSGIGGGVIGWCCGRGRGAGGTGGGGGSCEAIRVPWLSRSSCPAPWFAGAAPTWPSRFSSSCAAGGRRPASLDRQRPIRSRSGPAGSADRSGSSLRIRLMMTGSVSASNGDCPVAANTMVAAQAKMSTAGVSGAPVSCSGAR